MSILLTTAPTELFNSKKSLLLQTRSSYGTFNSHKTQNLPKDLHPSEGSHKSLSSDLINSKLKTIN
jgi:hypothetical protein